MRERRRQSVVDEEGGSMSDRTLPGGGFYRMGYCSGGQLDMSGGATLLLGNGEPGVDVDHDMVVDSVSIGDTSTPALLPRDSLSQGGWQANNRGEILLDATRVAATHPGIYAQVDNRSLQVRQEVHHHYPPPAEDRSQVDHVVYQANLREANIKTEVIAELSKRDMREASMLAEGHALQQRLAMAEAERVERDMREDALRREKESLRRSLTATEAELVYLRQQSQKVQQLEDLVHRLVLANSSTPPVGANDAPTPVENAGDIKPIGLDNTPAANIPLPCSTYDTGRGGTPPSFNPPPYDGGGGAARLPRKEEKVTLLPQ